MSKPIRRSDGKVLGDNKDQDEILLERLLPKQETPRENDWSQQITRNGEPLTERGREVMASLDGKVSPNKTWEEYKQELIDDLQHRTSERPLDSSDDIDCGVDPKDHFN